MSGAQKYTPGPWEAVKAEHDEQHGFGWWLRSPSYGCVGYWTGGKLDHADGRWQLSESDARLIAAAPDMLEALKDLAEAARNACDARQHPPLTNALFDADQAIAKATGEQP